MVYTHQCHTASIPVETGIFLPIPPQITSSEPLLYPYSYRLPELQIPSFSTLWHIGKLCRPPYIITVLVQGPHYYFTIFRWILRSYSTDTILRAQIASDKPTPMLYSACETDKVVLRYASITGMSCKCETMASEPSDRAKAWMRLADFCHPPLVIGAYLSYALSVSKSEYRVGVGLVGAIWTPKIVSVL